MRIIIFIVFIMMIIIFINELKNISTSFFQINYIKDVADINIKKHCNDIYCEAETGRFNIAKNSYKLLLPNDFYNTKTYYFMILLIIIIFYINIYYNLIKYNNLYYPYISNDGGTICITIIKNIPYIFAFLTLVLIIVTLIMRYAPTETEGYRNYFNIDNPVVSDFNKLLNINSLYNYIMLVIVIIFFVYYFSTTWCNNYIYTYPVGVNKLATINQNMSMGYMIITILLTYLLLNIMNIILSFSDNKYPKLNNNNYRDIITKNYKQVLNENIELKRENILLSCYTNTISTRPDLHTGLDIMYSDKKVENIKYGITVITLDTEKNIIQAVLYDKIDYLDKKDNATNYELKNIFINYYFTYISPLIPYKISDTLTDNVGKIRYIPEYRKNYEMYKDNIHALKNKVDAAETIINNYKEIDTSYNGYYMIDNIRIGLFNKDNDNDDSKLNKILILFNHISPKVETSAPPTIKTKEDFENKYNVLLDVLLYFCINEINYWNTYTSKDIYDNDNSTNYQYIKDTIYPDYDKHTYLLNLIKYLKYQKANSKKIISDAMDNNTVSVLKDNLIKEIKNYSKYDKNANSAGNKKQFFGKEYNMLSNITEIKENFSADISYGSANTFYEQYFNISNNDMSAYDVEYKIGRYFVKNIKFLIYFIIIIIMIAILLIIFLYRNENASLMAFAYDVMMPLLILLIFVIYIYLFMNFNTNYNLNVIYGLFDSSYKRDLNDMNNLIIPFIKLHSNSKDKYDKDYYDLYIITNVLASFLYSDNNYDKTPKYKTIYHKHEKTDAIYSKEETIDYNGFKKYYNNQFIIINEEFKDDFDKIKNPNSDKNLHKLYLYINKNIKTDIKKDFHYQDFVNSFKTYSETKILNIILICLELFGNNKDAYKNSAFVKDNFYFEKDKSGNLIPHKFRFKQSVFDKIYDYSKTPYIKIDDDIKVYIGKEDKKAKIQEIINNYMNIISLFQYNYILSINYDTMAETDKIKIEIKKNANDIGIKNPNNYLHQYKNKRLISLISNTKGFDKSFDKKTFELAEDTFKYSKSASTTDTTTTDSTSDKAGDVMYVYTNIIETYKINVSNISDNYLENVIKTICYQVDNRDVIMNEEGGTGDEVSAKMGSSNIKNKNGDAYDNQINILHKANQCISYDIATNYTVNLIMLGIIYSIGLYNNKIF